MIKQKPLRGRINFWSHSRANYESSFVNNTQNSTRQRSVRSEENNVPEYHFLTVTNF